jgi:hypothetical protein
VKSRSTTFPTAIDSPPATITGDHNLKSNSRPFDSAVDDGAWPITNRMVSISSFLFLSNFFFFPLFYFLFFVKKKKKFEMNIKEEIEIIRLVMGQAPSSTAESN